MKLLYSFYKHLTEVVLPRLALEHKWDVYGEKDIQLRLCNYLGIKHPPSHPSRNMITSKQLKDLVILCYELQSNPNLWQELYD